MKLRGLLTFGLRGGAGRLHGSLSRTVPRTSIMGRLSGLDPVVVRLAALFIIIVGSWFVSRGFIAGARVAAESARAQESAFESLRKEYLAEAALMLPLEEKSASAAPAGGVNAVMEEAARLAGAGRNLSSLKPVDAAQPRGYSIQGVEVKLGGVTLNQAVNFLFRIENDQRLLVVRDLRLKARFEDPGLLDLTAQVFLMEKVL